MLRAYCPQIYNVIIVVPLLLCKVNSKVTVTLRYTEALKLHCFFQKTVHLQGFWPKTVYLKCFGNQLKTVYLQGPRSSRPCISRPCCNFNLTVIVLYSRKRLSTMYQTPRTISELLHKTLVNFYIIFARYIFKCVIRYFVEMQIKRDSLKIINL